MIDNDLCLFRRQILQKHPLFQKLRQLPHYPPRSKVRQYSQLCQEFGRPDISGGMVGGNTNYQQTTVWGAIAVTSGGDYGNTAKAGHTRPDWTFYASRSNNKYGQTSTIQPQAFHTLIIVKV